MWVFRWRPHAYWHPTRWTLVCSYHRANNIYHTNMSGRVSWHPLMSVPLGPVGSRGLIDLPAADGGNGGLFTGRPCLQRCNWTVSQTRSSRILIHSHRLGSPWLSLRTVHLQRAGGWTLCSYQRWPVLWRSHRQQLHIIRVQAQFEHRQREKILIYEGQTQALGSIDGSSDVYE